MKPGSRYEAYRDGTVGTKVRPEAIRVMAEIGIDISKQESKTLDRYLTENFDGQSRSAMMRRKPVPSFQVRREEFIGPFPTQVKPKGMRYNGWPSSVMYTTVCRD